MKLMNQLNHQHIYATEYPQTNKIIIIIELIIIICGFIIHQQNYLHMDLLKIQHNHQHINQNNHQKVDKNVDQKLINMMCIKHHFKSVFFAFFFKFFLNHYNNVLFTQY